MHLFAFIVIFSCCFLLLVTSFHVSNLFSASQENLFYWKKSKPDEVVMVENKTYSSSLILLSCEKRSSSSKGYVKFFSLYTTVRVKNYCDNRQNYYQRYSQLFYSDGLKYRPKTLDSFKVTCFDEDSQLVYNRTLFTKNTSQSKFINGKFYACYAIEDDDLNYISKLIIFQVPHPEQVHPATRYFITKIISEVQTIRFNVKILSNIQMSNISYFGTISKNENCFSTVLLLCNGCAGKDVNGTKPNCNNVKNTPIHFDQLKLFENSISFDNLIGNSLYDVKWWALFDDNPPLFVSQDSIWTLKQTSGIFKWKAIGSTWICLESTDQQSRKYLISFKNVNSTWNDSLVFDKTQIINITNLSPNNLYEIQWQSHNGTNWMPKTNEKLLGKTLATRPRAPNALVHKTINKTSVKLSWKDQLNEDLTNLNYRVECVCDFVTMIKTITNRTNIFLTLHPDKNYSCFIYTMNEFGVSYPSVPLLIQSPSIEDKIIQNLSLDGIGSNSLSLSWQAPNNKSLMSYLLLVTSGQANRKVCNGVYSVFDSEMAANKVSEITNQHACGKKSSLPIQTLNASTVDEKVSVIVDNLDLSKDIYTINVIPYVLETQGEMTELITNVLFPQFELFNITVIQDELTVNFILNFTDSPVKVSVVDNGMEYGHHLVTNSQQIVFEDLNSFTLYEIKTCLFDKVTSNCIPIFMKKTFAWTSKSQPSFVSYIDYKMLNKSMVQLFWDPPEIKGGETITYEVICDSSKRMRWFTNDTKLQISINPSLLYECYVRANNEKFNGLIKLSNGISFGNMTSFCNDVGVFDIDFELDQVVWKRPNDKDCKRAHTFWIIVTARNKRSSTPHCEFGWVFVNSQAYDDFLPNETSSEFQTLDHYSYIASYTQSLVTNKTDCSEHPYSYRIFRAPENEIRNEIIYLSGGYLFHWQGFYSLEDFSIQVVATTEAGVSQAFNLPLTKLVSRSVSPGLVAMWSIFGIVVVLSTVAFVWKNYVQQFQRFTQLRFKYNGQSTNQEIDNVLNS